MKFLFSPIVVMILLLSSCNNSPEKLKGEITKLETDISADMGKSMDTNKLNQLIDLYQKYAEKFPEDSLAPEYLYRSSNCCQTVHKSKNAIAILEKICDTYPNYSRTPECLFMQAFIFENSFQDLGEANVRYNKFIAKYPDHPLAESASIAIKNLGKPLDEIIREFESKKDSLTAKNGYE